MHFAIERTERNAKGSDSDDCGVAPDRLNQKRTRVDDSVQPDSSKKNRVSQHTAFRDSKGSILRRQRAQVEGPRECRKVVLDEVNINILNEADKVIDHTTLGTPLRGDQDVNPLELTVAREAYVEAVQSATSQGARAAANSSTGEKDTPHSFPKTSQQSQSIVEHEIKDTTKKFVLSAAKAHDSKLRETDAHKLNQRQKQIDFGKNTIGYERYCELFPRNKRRPRTDPTTPDKYRVCSKRCWDGSVKAWRRLLHEYDPPVEEGEELPEVLE